MFFLLLKINPIAHNMITNASGEHWRQIRTVLSPTFTHKKVRELFPLIFERIMSLVDLIKSTESKNPIQVKCSIKNFV